MNQVKSGQVKNQVYESSQVKSSKVKINHTVDESYCWWSTDQVFQLSISLVGHSIGSVKCLIARSDCGKLVNTHICFLYLHFEYFYECWWIFLIISLMQLFIFYFECLFFFLNVLIIGNTFSYNCVYFLLIVNWYSI